MMALYDDLQRLVDAERTRSGAHGLVLRVQSGDGRIDHSAAAGAAEPDMRFPIASISKIFTAAMIVQLCDTGQLSLEQSVQSALPGIDLSGLHVVGCVDHTPRLTIGHLLFQTSGLPQGLKECCTAQLPVPRLQWRPAKLRFPFHLAERDFGRSV